MSLVVNSSRVFVVVVLVVLEEVVLLEVLVVVVADVEVEDNSTNIGRGRMSGGCCCIFCCWRLKFKQIQTDSTNKKKST